MHACIRQTRTPGNGLVHDKFGRVGRGSRPASHISRLFAVLKINYLEFETIHAEDSAIEVLHETEGDTGNRGSNGRQKFIRLPPITIESTCSATTFL